MPKEAVVHKVRKGTKSCTECRHRKIRCIWPEESSVCDGCKARGRSCQAQVFSTPAADAANLTSRDRIRHLEGEIDALWSVVKDLQNTAGREVQPHSATAVSMGSSVHGETDHDEFSPSNPPVHLRQLFNNGLLDTRESDEDEDTAVRGATTAGVYYTETKNLQRLLPSREDVAAISKYSSAALALYHALFTRLTVILKSKDMLDQYDQVSCPDAHPNRVANLLLTLALTAQQIPAEDASNILTSIKDVSKFIADVSAGFEKNIANNDTLGGTMEGIETSLVYTRLMLAFADLKKVYLSLRRVIALAELHGLPRAARAAYNQSTSNTPPTPADERNHSAAGLWSSICAADRFAGLMFNMPVATAGHPLPHAPLLLPNGQVHGQAYFTRLGEIAIQIQQLDGGYGPELSESQRFAKVRDIDQQLQSLAGLTPHAWWAIDPSPQTITADHLVQIWHQYFTIRAHLQLALSNGASMQYHQSYITCASACENMGLRYIALRPNVPSGFACRMLDIQILTAGVFLLSAEMGVNNAANSSHGSHSPHIVKQLLSALDAASPKSGGDIARKAAATLRSLRQLWNDPYASEMQDMALRVPLLGKVRVRRKIKPNTPLSKGSHGPSPPMYQNVQAQNPQYAAAQSQAAQSSADMSAFWSMDLMEDIPSMPDTMFDMEQWFSNNDFNDISMAFPMDSTMY